VAIKPLQYYEHTAWFEGGPPYHGEVLTYANEVHELATDIYHIGAVALFSEVKAATVVGHPVEVAVPNPISTYAERRTPKRLFGKGKKRHKRITGTLANASEALDDLQTRLNGYAATGETNGILQDVAPNSSGLQVFRAMEGDGEQEMILRSADISPFLKVSKDLTAEAQGKEPKEFGWKDWLSFASDEQLINFSQWYTERLKTLADPKSKAKYVKALKSDYEERVGKAVQEGWIDGKHKAALALRMTRTDIRFFSPFGRMPDYVGGLAQKRGLGKNILLLPTLAGKQATVHELSHVFAGVDGSSMRGYFNGKIGKDQVARMKPRLEHLYTHLYAVLNEGYIEHMTAALLDGAPTTIVPAEREAKGIVETEGSSGLYKAYREIFGVLVGGEDSEATNADIKVVVDSMVIGDFGQFAHHINQKWGERDVLTEMLEVVAQHDNDAWRSENFTKPEYNDELLAKKMIERLHNTTNPSGDSVLDVG
jgi:hypothetical protein